MLRTVPAPPDHQSLTETPTKIKKAKPRGRKQEVRVKPTKHRVQLTVTIPSRQYLVVASSSDEPSFRGATVALRHGARIYELRLVSDSFADELYAQRRDKGPVVPVIPPPPSLTDLSAWVWCPGGAATYL